LATVAYIKLNALVTVYLTTAVKFIHTYVSNSTFYSEPLKERRLKLVGVLLNRKHILSYMCGIQAQSRLTLICALVCWSIVYTSSTIMGQTTNRGLFTCSYIKSVAWHHKSRTWHPRFDYSRICRPTVYLLTSTYIRPVGVLLQRNPYSCCRAWYFWSIPCSWKNNAVQSTLIWNIYIAHFGELQYLESEAIIVYGSWYYSVRFFWTTLYSAYKQDAYRLI